MIVHEGYNDLSFSDPFVTIGVFDGVHLGHQALLERLVSRTKESGGESVVITFSPHPRLIIDKDVKRIFYLSALSEKLELLEKSQVGNLIILNFTKELQNMEASDFIRDILVKKIGIRHLIIGYDNHFGKSRKGDFSKILECAEQYGFTTEKVDGIYTPDGIISSTSIREALLKGNLDYANQCLGYSYSVTGTVIRGKKFGRLFGFPTANIKVDDTHKLIPADGVYAVEVRINEIIHPGVMSIGFNPTVSNDRKTRSIEVNIFDFDDDLYGRKITIFFRYRLRNEKKFDNVKLLIKQMELDREEALRLLK